MSVSRVSCVGLIFAGAILAQCSPDPESMSDAERAVSDQSSVPYEDRVYRNPSAAGWTFSAEGKARDLCEHAKGMSSDDSDSTITKGTATHLGDNRWDVNIQMTSSSGTIMGPSANCVVDLTSSRVITKSAEAEDPPEIAAGSGANLSVPSPADPIEGSGKVHSGQLPDWALGTFAYSPQNCSSGKTIIFSADGFQVGSGKFRPVKEVMNAVSAREKRMMFGNPTNDMTTNWVMQLLNKDGRWTLTTELGSERDTTALYPC